MQVKDLEITILKEAAGGDKSEVEAKEKECKELIEEKTKLEGELKEVKRQY